MPIPYPDTTCLGLPVREKAVGVDWGVNCQSRPSRPIVRETTGPGSGGTGPSVVSLLPSLRETGPGDVQEMQLAASRRHPGGLVTGGRYGSPMSRDEDGSGKPHTPIDTTRYPPRHYYIDTLGLQPYPQKVVRPLNIFLEECSMAILRLCTWLTFDGTGDQLHTTFITHENDPSTYKCVYIYIYVYSIHAVYIIYVYTYLEPE